MTKKEKSEICSIRNNIFYTISISYNKRMGETSYTFRAQYFAFLLTFLAS